MPIDDHQPVILIAEDEDNDVSMLRRAFEQLNFVGSLQFVRDGEEAIAYLGGNDRFAARDEFPMPAFFLLDLKMPRINGFEVLEFLHARPDLAQLRTIVLTTSNDPREVDKAYRLGAASFLTKPVNFTDFKDTIEALMKYWLCMNQPAPVWRPDKSASVTQLASAIRSQYHVRSLHTQTVRLSLLGRRNKQLQYNVSVFNLIACPEARECFAWFERDEKPIIVLATAQINSPEKAVRSFYKQPAR